MQKLNRVIWVQKHHKSNVIVEKQYDEKRKKRNKFLVLQACVYDVWNAQTEALSSKLSQSDHAYIKMYFFIQTLFYDSDAEIRTT